MRSILCLIGVHDWLKTETINKGLTSEERIFECSKCPKIKKVLIVWEKMKKCLICDGETGHKVVPVPVSDPGIEDPLFSYPPSQLLDQCIECGALSGPETIRIA